MKNADKVMVLFDTEKEYALLMGEFLKKNKTLGWDVHIYSEEDELMDKENSDEIALLLVSEKAYSEKVRDLSEDRLIVLSEEGLLKNDKIRFVDKYKRADEVLREALLIYLDIAGEEIRLSKNIKNSGTKFIGFYSPVHRCLQTGIAFTLASMLSADYKTLYLNFEYYPGYATLMASDGQKDLSDLLYFLNEEKERFALRLKTIVLKSGELDYIPSVRTMQNLTAVERRDWVKLIDALEDSGEYEYVVMDLSEGVSGLFDILRLCHRVFTMTERDRMAECKLLNYEAMLSMYEFGDVKERTVRLNVPKVKRLPEELYQYSKSELAEYTRKNILEKCL